MLQTIADTLVAWGPLGILLLGFLDSAGIPIPEGTDALVVLVAMKSARAGYLAAALATAGSLAGCWFLFSLGRKGGEVYLNRQIERQRRAEKFRLWFHRYGLLTVFIPALIPAPLPLKIFVLSAGALGIRLRNFLLVVLAARVPRFFGEAWLGSRLGNRPREFFREHTWELLLAAAVLFLFLAALIKLHDRRRSRAAASR